MLLQTVLYVLDLLPFAVFFGIAVYMWMAPYYRQVSARAFIEFFQGVDPYMKVWAKRLVLTQLFLSLVIVISHLVQRQWLPGALSTGAFLGAVVSLVLAIRGNVPLNEVMTKWDPASPPADWAEVRDRWLWWHHVRAIAETAGFLLLLAAALCYVGAR